ncbi:hypothetical protein ACLX1H_010500 [Fusarium chlamydosporum]
MNNSKWLPNARAVLVARTRLASSGCNSNARLSTASPKSNETRSSSAPRPRRQSGAPANPRFNNAKKPQRQSSPREAPNDSTKHKLVLSGLPTTLLPADFNRLAADKLAGWNEIISHAATWLYKNKLERLLRLAQIKFQCKDGLWTAKIPPVLLEKGKDPEKELERFTILPGSYQARIKTKQARVQGKMAWQHVIDQIIKSSHIKALRPSAVLIELPEKSFPATELQAIINQDGVESG